MDGEQNGLVVGVDLLVHLPETSRSPHGVHG